MTIRLFAFADAGAVGLFVLRRVRPVNGPASAPSAPHHLVKAFGAHSDNLNNLPVKAGKLAGSIRKAVESFGKLVGLSFDRPYP